MRQRQLYPTIEPRIKRRLKVSDLHEIYVEECGNPEGKPVIVLHGGPGAGCNPAMRRFFDPQVYRIILFDQRGCGRSTPSACCDENTTWDLVSDMERIRGEFEIESWMLFGGSWGSTLALAYAETHPQRVTEMVLRGIFLIRREEIDWFHNGGCARFHPELWEEFISPIPEVERGDMVSAYHKRLFGEDAHVRLACARAWSRWEGATVTMAPSPQRANAFARDDYALAFSRIEAHYFLNGGFMDEDGQLLRDVKKISNIPGIIVQGRYDVVTPPTSAWALHKAWPASELYIAPDAGHAVSEPSIATALLEATDRFRWKS
ncbi:UNVERIFIED_CONTAM: hypothetical protein GTU68_008645 [Idotea baltica]|nr:hypothetical protein [Idotea baltica]